MQQGTRVEPLDLKNRTWAAFLSWLVPGLGQLYQGRRAKGLLFFVCISSLFMFGLYLGEWKSVYWCTDDHLPRQARPRGPIARVARYLGLSGACRLGMGAATIPSAIQWWFRDRGPVPLLGKFGTAPSVAELHELHARRNRVWEVAVLYTMIAGLLNVLVIWDAYEGPAYQDEEGEPAETDGAGVVVAGGTVAA